MKKTILITVLALVALGYAVSFLPLDFLVPSLERSLETALGRRVEIGSAHLTFLNGPGVGLDRVTIHEDPRAGIEPFAYADTVQARLDLLALLGGHLAISSLRFDDASLNLVKPANEPWNFQMLLARAPNASSASSARPLTSISVPSIKMRSGRVNIKYSQTKSVLFFDDVDMEISPAGDHLDLRFSGVPARTDRPVRNLEHFFIRGTYEPSASEPLRLTAEMQPSPMDAVARLFVADIFPLSGSLTANAEITGAPANLKVTGEARLDTGAKWSYQGTLDLPDQQLQLQSAVENNIDNSVNRLAAASAPIRIHVWDLLNVPHWEIQLEQAPIETFVGIARRLGAPLPDPLSVEGRADGSIAYRGPEGIEGRFDLSDVVFAVPDSAARSARRAGAVAAAQPPRIQVPQAVISIHQGLASFGPANVRFGPNSTLDISVQYNLDAWNGAELRISSKGFDLRDLDPRVVSGVPVLARAVDGIWRGTLFCERPDDKSNDKPDDKAACNGSFDLQNAQLSLDGFADPLEVISAGVVLKGSSVDVTRLRARLGKILFNGEYHWDQSADQAHTFRVQAGEVPAAELERLFAPALTRSGGFFSRTLGLGSPAPDWLAKRQATGIISIQVVSPVSVGSVQRLKLIAAPVIWNGSTFRLVALNSGSSHALIEDTPLTGELRVDVSGAAPQYRFKGKIDGAAYKGGHLEAHGELNATGTGMKLLSTANAQGTFRAQSIQFAPDAEFRKASGRFSFVVAGDTPQLTLSNLEITQGAEVYHGTGTTEGGATLLLELSEAGRTAHYSGSLFTMPGATPVVTPIAAPLSAPARGDPERSAQSAAANAAGVK